MARVLVVDDEQSIRTTLSVTLSKAGHTIFTASTAAEALSKLEAEPFDVVISDIILPRKTGVVLLGEIRDLQPDVQVIMITGEPEVTTAAAAVRKGAFDYLAKPVSREAITKVVASATEKKTLLDRTRQLEAENLRYQDGLEEQVALRTKQLQESQDRYLDLYENAPAAYFSVDASGNVINCNKQACELLGLSAQELLGRPVVNLYADTPSGRSKALRVLALFRAGRPIENEELQIQTFDDSPKWISLSVSAIRDVNDQIIASRSVAIDITEQRAAAERESWLLAQQTIINQITLELGSVTDVEQVYGTVHDHVSALMDVKALIISFYDEGQHLLRAGYAQFEGQPFDVAKLPPIPLEPPGQGTQSEVIHTGKPLYLPDVRETLKLVKTQYMVNGPEAAIEDSPSEDEEDVTRSALYVPIQRQGIVIGVMQIQSWQLDAYSEGDLAMLGGIANVLAVAIANARLIQDIQDALKGTVSIVGNAMAVRDPYTAGHQKRVTQLACAIAEKLGLDKGMIEGLRVAGLLHDIGKIAIPAEILSKPSRLSKMEFELIKQHSTVGYELLEPIRFPWPVATIVRQHHERMDGSGYPQGLTGDEILPEARILAVADVVEAMSSHRPYRPSLGIELALEEIENRKGDVYDLAAADACIGLFVEEGFQFAE